MSSWFINGIKEFSTSFTTTYDTTASTSHSTTTTYNTSKSTTTSYNTSKSTTTTFGTSRTTSRTTTSTVNQSGPGGVPTSMWWGANWSMINIRWSGTFYRNLGGNAGNYNTVNFGGYTYYKGSLSYNLNDGYPYWAVSRSGPSSTTTSYTTSYNTSRSTTTTYGTSHSTTTTFSTSKSTTTTYNTTASTSRTTTRTTNFYA